MVFFYLFRIKKNAGSIHSRVADLAGEAIERDPRGDFRQDFRLEGAEIHARILWRLPGLRYAVYPGIREGFAVEKTNLETGETARQLFVTNRPARQWDARSVLDRILLHWDTETGVFGVKDNTFCEDKARYKSVEGAMAHVSLLNFACNCLSAPVFEGYWKGEPMSCRIRFWKDHPEYNPFGAK